MKNQTTSRRNLLTGVAAVVGGCTIGAKNAVAALTVGAAEGPFYPRPSMRMPDIDNDLVKVAGALEEAGGEVITLRGVISNRDGLALEGLRIEIWQCDVNGKYLHTGDDRNIAYNQAFQGFGHDITDETGAYVFRTIKPTVYPGRTPHIHVKVLDGPRELLTTQFYIQGEANNTRDALFRRMSEAEADAVSMVFIAGDNGPETTVNVVL